jgi:hypothetical protein
MYTSIVLLALTGSAAPSALSAKVPAWQSDYEAAFRQGSRDRKPLAVVFGSGPYGWDGVCKEGRFNKEIPELLDAHYVPVYVDTDKPEGQRLARSFEMAKGPGLVLSDGTGQYQAFRHEGDLTNDELARQLRKYADPDRVVRRTDTAVRVETAAYPPPQAYTPVAPAFAPAFAPAPMGFMGGFSAGRGC